jgi:hypothetical protein
MTIAVARATVPRVAGLVYPSLKQLALGYASAEAWLRQLQDALNGAARGLLGTALRTDEQEALGIAIYDRNFRPTARDALFAAERAWLLERLPHAPAQLLVGGAGSGREAQPLCELGHHVDAFEPAARPMAACAARVGERGEVLRGRYEDLSRAVLDGGGGPLAPFASRRYDAVLLGWTSLSCVLEPDERRRLIAACDRLAPEGPLLVTMWMTTQAALEGRAQRAGRAAGTLVGSTLGRLRGVHADEPAAFASGGGFYHLFSTEEIEALATSVGRTVAWGAGNWYPHATFLPQKLR